MKKVFNFLHEYYVIIMYKVLPTSMYYLTRRLIQYYRSKMMHVFIISVLVYAVINMIENYIHYNIGRNKHDTTQFEFFSPSMKDWSQMAIIMIVFALLQGILTITVECYFYSK